MGQTQKISKAEFCVNLKAEKNKAGRTFRLRGDDVAVFIPRRVTLVRGTVGRGVAARTVVSTRQHTAEEIIASAMNSAELLRRYRPQLLVHLNFGNRVLEQEGPVVTGHRTVSRAEEINVSPVFSIVN